MITINLKIFHSSTLEPSSHYGVLLGLLVKLRWIHAIDPEHKVKGLILVFRAGECCIHAHKVLELDLSFTLWDVTHKYSGG